MRGHDGEGVSMASRMSPGRRVLLVVAVVIGVLAWAVAVMGWTALGRISTNAGFLDVTIETIQSPTGIEAASSALAAQVEQGAVAHGAALTPQGRQTIQSAVAAVLSQEDLGQYLEQGVSAARSAFEERPGDGITIDVSALRPQIVAQLETRNPQLAARVPPAGDLVVVIPPGSLPDGVGTVATLISMARWTPVVLVGVTVIFIALGLLVTDDRARTLRRTGVAFVLVGILPVLMRLIIPPVVGSAIDGTPGAVAEVAASATIANWWIALLVTVVVGAALVLAGRYMRQPARAPGGPTVLGR